MPIKFRTIEPGDPQTRQMCQEILDKGTERLKTPQEGDWRLHWGHAKEGEDQPSAYFDATLTPNNNGEMLAVISTLRMYVRHQKQQSVLPSVHNHGYLWVQEYKGEWRSRSTSELEGVWENDPLERGSLRLCWLGGLGMEVFYSRVPSLPVAQRLLEVLDRYDAFLGFHEFKAGCAVGGYLEFYTDKRHNRWEDWVLPLQIEANNEHWREIYDELPEIKNYEEKPVDEIPEEVLQKIINDPRVAWFYG